MPHSKYLPERMGTAVVEPSGPAVAGSYRSFTVTYTAGFFGIDDTGSIKIVHRFASDMGRPQFDDPAAANYVSAEASNTVRRVTVADTGPGITSEDQTLIFDRFYRTDRSRDRATGGSGLGLTIARQMVEAHGGIMGVESDPGLGSRFFFELPLTNEG